MSSALTPRPRIIGPKVRICVVATKYEDGLPEVPFANALVENTVEELSELLPQGRVDLIRVPGIFEIPVTMANILDRSAPACMIALGVLFRSSTNNPDILAKSVTDSLQALAIEHKLPIIHEVLLVEDEKQAYAYSIGAKLNRGRKAARAAASMIDIFQELDRTMPKTIPPQTRREA